jgi:hypothetical protein
MLYSMALRKQPLEGSLGHVMRCVAGSADAGAARFCAWTICTDPQWGV